MADLSHPLAYAEEHPYVAGAVVFGGGLALLWLFGFFSSSSGSGTDAATTSMAAAYYAAEAQQAVAGTQLNIATEQAQASTDQAQIQANAAVAIEQAHGTTAQNIASSMYASNTTLGQAGFDAQTTQASYAADVAKTGIVYGAQTQQVQANDATAASVASNNYAYLTSVSNNHAAEFTDAVHTVVAPELARSGGYGNFSLGDLGFMSVNTGAPQDPGNLLTRGYDPATVARIVRQEYGFA
jgi:hypothetical protein